jgi:hypothetical protein
MFRDVIDARCGQIAPGLSVRLAAHVHARIPGLNSPSLNQYQMREYRAAPGSGSAHCAPASARWYLTETCVAGRDQRRQVSMSLVLSMSSGRSTRMPSSRSTASARRESPYCRSTKRQFGRRRTAQIGEPRALRLPERGL